MNAVLFKHGSKKWLEFHVEVFLRKSLNFRTQVEHFSTHNFKNELVSYVVYF